MTAPIHHRIVMSFYYKSYCWYVAIDALMDLQLHENCCKISTSNETSKFSTVKLSNFSGLYRDQGDHLVHFEIHNITCQLICDLCDWKNKWTKYDGLLHQAITLTNATNTVNSKSTFKPLMCGNRITPVQLVNIMVAEALAPCVSHREVITHGIDYVE